MEEITIVRKRSRLWPTLIAILVLAVVLAAVWCRMTDGAAAF